MSDVLRIIGCRAGSPVQGSPASGYLLRTSKGNILIDCGSGVLVNMLDRDFDNLIGVVVTHCHADHCLDLMALAYRQVFPVLSRKLPLYGPPSLLHIIQSYDKLFGIPSLPTMGKPITTAFDFHPVVPGEQFTVGGFWSFDTLRMIHPVETMAIRSIEFSFVFTADGAYTQALQDFCTGSRFILSEATYPDEVGHNILEHGHMAASQCAALAQKAGARLLVVTHLSDPADNAVTMETIGRSFTGEARLAQPGLEIECFPQ